MAGGGTEYRKFDAHAHVLGPKALAAEILDGAGVERVLNLSVSDLRSEPPGFDEFEEMLLEESDDYPGRFLFGPAFPIRGFEAPGYVEETIAKLEEDFARRGAVAVKVWKALGMTLKDAQGRYVFCDDARFKPIFDYLADRNAVVVLHMGDPKAGWEPLDPESPHYRYFKEHPEFHLHGRTDVPSYEELMRRRDALVARYPYVRFVGAHLASLEHDVEAVGEFLHRFPNAYVDTSARQWDLMRQPVEKVRRFFEKYAHRILYGTDWGFHPRLLGSDEEERAKRVKAAVDGFVRGYRYFEETLGLSPEILEQFYRGNAERLFGAGKGEGG